MGNVISGGNQFCRKSELFAPLFCISILKLLQTQILRHSLDINAFWMIQEYFCQGPEIPTNQEDGANFWREPILQKIWIIWKTLLYFNFNSFTDSNSFSFIRFQCIVHDLGVLFSDSWNFNTLEKGDLISGGKQFCREYELFGPRFCISILKVLWTQILRH